MAIGRSDEPASNEGRFRTFLIRCLTNYQTNEWKKEHRLMRSPPGGFVPLEMSDGETRYEHEPTDEETPEKLFDRRWAATLVEQATARLRTEYEQEGKLALFEQLEPHLGGGAERGIAAQVAAGLDMSEEALRVALHRLRKRFGEILRETIAQTVADPADVDDELRYLIRLWGEG